MIEAIERGGKDVLFARDFKRIRDKFSLFLKIQRRLGKAFFRNAGASARLIASCGDDSETEP